MEAPPGPEPMALDAPPAATAAAEDAAAAVPPAGGEKVSGWPRSGAGSDLRWGSGPGAARSTGSVDVVANGACFLFVCLALVVQKEGEGGERGPGHIISTTIGGKNGEPKRVSCDSLSCLYVCLSVARVFG